MKPNEIKAAMALAEVTQQSIAKELGVTRQMVSRVVLGRGISKPIMALIAERCGRDPRRMWGARRFSRAA